MNVSDCVVPAGGNYFSPETFASTQPAANTAAPTPRTCSPNVSAVSAVTPTPTSRVVSRSSSAHFAVVSVVTPS